jgi:hypothetical protein
MGQARQDDGSPDAKTLGPQPDQIVLSARHPAGSAAHRFVVLASPIA